MFSWSPVNDLESHLAKALTEGDEVTAQLLLLTGRFSVHARSPEDTGWPIVTTAEGDRWVTVYTSPELCHASTNCGLRYREFSLAQLAAMWPDNSVGLSINPVVANLAFALEPAAFARLVAPRLDQLMWLYPPGTIPYLQKVLRGDELTRLLGAQTHTVSGFVHLYDEVYEIGDPQRLLEVVGIADDARRDVVFDDGSLHLLRWPGLGLDLYRTPLGGRDDRQRAAVDGWVIAPDPFIGLGLTPSPTAPVHEYYCTAVAIPHGSEIHQMMPDGSSHRRAAYDAVAGRWRRVLAQQGTEQTARHPAEAADDQ
ncbi:hypothetical protein [Blastococcus sp. Marseille-P5729]|uniref:hypothetical protein n=1 Tax=Blastococcus sp. Marseille-P5729 TaxID=2086582 RepID=UPI00131AE9D2|nr:hypothetical protein [Blastococcus sp. Marseille-P5729]